MTPYLHLATAVLIAHTAVAHRVGPAKNPFAHPDFGGTPDWTIPGQLTLDATELEELERRFAEADRRERQRAAAALLANARGSERSLRRALWRRRTVRNAAIKAVLRAAAQRAGDDVSALLDALLALPPDTPAVPAAAFIAHCLAALQQVDTLAGYKTLIEFSPHYAGAFRRLIGRLFVAAGMPALPALVYCRGASDREMRLFCIEWIRDIGNPLLSEQVQKIHNSRRLAQLLEAYASVNDLDAIPITLSLANHESDFVRQAARSALKAYDANVKWRVFDAYENTFGDSPSDGSDWNQWLQALYDKWDADRNARYDALYDEGAAAARAKNWKTMDAKFRAILTERPLFPRSDDMAAAYLAWSTAAFDAGDTDAAAYAATMAARLATDPQRARAAQRAAQWPRKVDLAAKGALDAAYFSAVIHRDGARRNAARRILDASRHTEQTSLWWRSAGVGLLIFAASLLVYRRIRARKTA